MANWGWGVGAGLMGLLGGAINNAGQSTADPTAGGFEGVRGKLAEMFGGIANDPGKMKMLQSFADSVPHNSPYRMGAATLGGAAGGRLDSMEAERERLAEDEEYMREGAAQKQSEEEARLVLERMGGIYPELGDFATGKDPLGRVEKIANMMRAEEKRAGTAGAGGGSARSGGGSARSGGGGGGGRSGGGRRRGYVMGGPGRLDDIETAAPAAPAIPGLEQPNVADTSGIGSPISLLRPPSALSGAQAGPSMAAAPSAPPAISRPNLGGGAPAVGTIENGYRYIGGNPADPSSWEPVVS